MTYFHTLFLFCFLINNVLGELPEDFDALMEKFFETPECESFVSDGTYLSVATSACSPYTCDAPRQLCMREANRYQDETANQCRTIPEGCLTAANGGIPVTSARSIHTTPPSIFGGMRGNPFATINGNRPPPKIVTAPPDFRGTPPPPPRPFTSGAFGDICQQTVPDGRFCGFQLKFTYNRETGNCEQFWFPGCATDKTNDNLFGDLQSCQIATKHCRATPTQPPPPPLRLSTQRPRFTTAFPDYPNSGEEIPPPPPPPPVGGGSRGGGVDLGSLAGSFMGGGGNAGGLVGKFLGGGLGGGSGGSSRATNIGGGTPNGYGGGALGGAGGNGVGGAGGGGGEPQQPNFLKLITNTIGAVSAAKQAGAAPGGAGGGAQWLKNIDPQQITSIFSSFGR